MVTILEKMEVVLATGLLNRPLTFHPQQTVGTAIGIMILISVMECKIQKVNQYV